MSRWPEMRELFVETFKTRPRDEWAGLFDEVDACVAPVMRLTEAADHPHVKARETLLTRDGVTQPAPAPRFSRTAGEIQSPPRKPGEDTTEALVDWGFTTDEVKQLLDAGVVAEPEDPERGVYGAPRP
jgi:alpha-methylacyl-CoA racemase